MPKETQEDGLKKSRAQKRAEKAAKAAAITVGMEFFKQKADEYLSDPACPNRAAVVTTWEFFTASYENAFTNSSTSSLPPSQDPNREKQPKEKSETRKTGGQPGHPGKNLEWCDKPDKVIQCLLREEDLPAGHVYRKGEPEKRQVTDVVLKKVVTEYVADVWVDETGKKYVAKFPDCAKNYTSYGDSVAALSIELVLMQMVPLNRVETFMGTHFGISLCEGTIENQMKRAASFLWGCGFDSWIRRRLLQHAVLHFDETGCNVNGKKHWVHVTSSGDFVYFHLSPKRGSDATDEIGILPAFTGVAVHDCWVAYFLYGDCLHAICNSHLLRELEGVVERDRQEWASKMIDFLIEAEKLRLTQQRALTSDEYAQWSRRYRDILRGAAEECERDFKRNPTKRTRREKEDGDRRGSKTMALIRRMGDHESSILLFLTDLKIPFTNNQAERDLRMMKVKQKVSGCFRSFERGRDFCLLRSYLYTCLGHGMSTKDALSCLLSGSLPSFIDFKADLPQLKVILPEEKAAKKAAEKAAKKAAKEAEKTAQKVAREAEKVAQKAARAATRTAQEAKGETQKA